MVLLKLCLHKFLLSVHTEVDAILKFRFCRAIVSDYFPGMSSRISGIGVIGIEKKLKNYIQNLILKIYLLCQSVGFIGRKSGEDHQYQGK